MTFDSKKEARRYRELALLEKAGQIENLRCQVKFQLLPSYVEIYPRYSDKTGKRLTDGKKTIEKECSYIADFVYTENGKQVVEDTKGVRTPEYVIKRKLMLWVHNIKIKEV
jgi:hypothetical protein